MTSLHQNEEVLSNNTTCTSDPQLCKSTEPKVPMSHVPTNSFVEKRFNDIIKSPNDKKSYRGLLLKNKMRVMLISDPTTDKSAASMDVNIGYFSDPDDLPGLAHFCEHMLFMGTKKYPQENDYTLYLSQNGGSYNAVTNKDHTTYYFDIDPEKLENALDRFAQFFISPLFTETCTELELKALDSEHSKNLKNDIWRMHQLNKSSADPNHPFSKFGTGSRQTLEEIPKKNGINVRERLLEFHEKFYSSNVMSLCILGKENLNRLEQIVVDLFSEVRDKGIETPVWPTHPFNESHFQNKWYMVPVQDIRNLNISFCIPDMHEHYKSAPLHYIANLVGHEGEGSLLSALKAKGWCNYIVAVEGGGARGFSFFSVVVDLTEEGILHIDDITLMFFQYINMLNREGPVEWLFDEQRNIGEMNFRFEEKRTPGKYVNHLSQMIQMYPMEEVLTIGYLSPSWKPELIESLMKCITPEKARILVVGKQFESIATESEKWYGTKYKKEKIPQEIIEKWSNPGFNDALRLPPKNDFVPTKFDLKPPETTITKYPEIIEDTSLIRLWFKQDDEFLVPRTNLFFEFVSPVAYLDPVNYNLNYLFVSLLRDSMDEYLYAANLAGLGWNIRHSKHGVSVVIAGYDDKQRVLLEKIIDKMVNFKVDPKRFEVFKNKYIRALKNFWAEQPYKHASYYLAVLLSDQAWSKTELLKATSLLTAERVQQYISQFLGRVHIECLIHGNVTMSEAIDTAKLVESKLMNSVPNLVPLLPQHLLLDREIRLEDGCNFLYEVENNTHESSCANVYYQAGLESTETNMLLELLGQIISEPCFTTLRTKEQLGYIVSSGVQTLNGVMGLIIIVQGDRHPQYVDQRIASFLNLMLDHVTNMSEEEFKTHQESLAVRYLEKPRTLAAASSIFWNEISLQQYNFDRTNIVVAYLRTITREQLLTYFKKVIFSDTSRKLSVHVVSTVQDESGKLRYEKNEDEIKEDLNIPMKSFKKIEDIMTFKISQSLYPLVKPYNDIPRKGSQTSKL